MAEKDTDEWRSRGYPVQEDMRLQASHWRFERLLWSSLLIIVLAALAGAFSTGWLSDAQHATADGRLAVEYPRFTLNGAATEMTITARADDHGDAVLWLDGQFLSGFAVESLAPEPAESRSRGAGIEMRFRAEPDQRATIYLTIRARSIGVVRSTLGSPNSESLSLIQFTYP